MQVTVIHIGTITLNVAFILYLVVYVPQIIHNRCEKNLAHLSDGMHFSLFSGYLLDLFYGFSKYLPWQYKSVSVIGLILILIQHFQLIHYHKKQEQIYKLTINILALGVFIALSGIFFTLFNGHFSPVTTNLLGYAARFFFLIYLIPQLIKNKRHQAALAVSQHMIYLSLTLCLFDGISAWCLDWGWPNKLATPFTITLLLILLNQTKKRMV